MRYFGIFAFIFVFQTLAGQVKNELPFIRHLVNKGYYKEAIYLIDRNSFNYQNQQLDSLNYYHGWAHYSMKNLEESINSFLEIRENVSFPLGFLNQPFRVKDEYPGGAAFIVAEF